MKNKYSRRKFIQQKSVAGLGAMAGLNLSVPLLNVNMHKADAPVLLGGKPAIEHSWPSWPKWKPETDEPKLLEVMRSGVWSRNKVVDEFEKEWAQLLGVKRCLTVVNGTNALNASLAQYEIGWGDEVLVTPYSFIASVSCVVFNGAIPVFVDVDPETFQMDPAKIEAKITSNTRAILPVHILGLPCDMDPIMKIAKKHNLIVIEDACQAWLAEYDHKKLGTFGHAGCFSFQNSKNIPMGEGGAIVSNDDAFMDRCFSYHNYGNPYGSEAGAFSAGAVRIGTKLRLTEYQAAIGLVQLKRLEEETEQRNQNAALLRKAIDNISGILPYRLYEKANRASFHLFPFRYKKEAFKGLDRNKFLAALNAEGVPCSSGYRPLNKMPFLKNTFESKYYKKFYPSKKLNYNNYADANQCPLNDQLCEEAVWIPQNILLGSTADMEQIAMAIKKIYDHAEELR